MFTFTRFHRTMSRDDELNALNDNFNQLEKKSAEDQKTAAHSNGTWTDYTATLSGWSVTTTKETRYTVINNTVMVWVHIDGTSNSTSASISLPFPAKQSIIQLVRTWDGSNECIGKATVTINTSTLSVTHGSATGSFFNNWSASGQKQIASLMFIYEKKV